MRKGDIVLIPFPFTDLFGIKQRPALILVSSERDITVSFITTQLEWKEDLDILIDATPENGLKKTSLIRLSKLATPDNELVLGRLGTVSSPSIKIINKNLSALFKLND